MKDELLSGRFRFALLSRITLKEGEEKHPCPCCGGPMIIIWAAATELPHAGSAKDQDRHLISLQPMLDTHNDAHHLCWPCADNVTGRSFNPISSIGTTEKLTIKASKSPVARSRLQSSACQRGSLAHAAASFHLMNA
jgi:hypothetical protein